MSNLTVYSASAGSGKTFTLSAEYISKLLNGNPEAASHILAVTFTNKATTEMKSRILKNLYDIGYPAPSADSSGPKSDALFDKVKSLVEGKVSDDVLRQRARAALTHILHNYEHFSVQTIDSFLQSTLQYVAHELGQTANYAIDIDDERVRQQAVDNLLQSINEGTADAEVRSTVAEMMEEKIEDNKNWDITRDLNSFAQNLSKEVYMRHSDAITESIDADRQKPYPQRLVSVLRRMRDDARQAIVAAAEAALLHEDEIAQMSSGKKNYFLRCYKLATAPDEDIKNAFSASFTKSATASADDAPQVLLKKADQKNGVMVAMARSVHSVLKHVYDTHQAHACTYNSCQAALKHLNALGLLDAINRHVEVINRENNRIMLSRTPLLFEQLHAGSEASFVFEKAGVRYDHVMIDEFQDTSHLQWNNFKKLLIETASKDKSSLLVGDVKQSIYRWRNGDWGILANIGREVSRNISIRQEVLNRNFRSLDNIVRFNYVVSRYVAHCLDAVDEGGHPGEMSALVYKDVKQECTDHPGGYIRLATITEDGNWAFSETAASTSEPATAPKSTADLEAEMLEDMARQMLALRAQGHSYDGMAVLVRTNKQGKAVLKYFAAHHEKIPMISDEAYTLVASPAVELLRSLLRLLCEERNSVACSYVAEQYCKKHHKDTFDPTVFARIKGEGIHALAPYLPVGFIDSMDTLRHIPLYECCETLISLFDINQDEHQAPYVYAFLDDVISYMNEASGDLYAYLTYLDSVLEKRSIPSATGQGVVVMTIHKSKGLEFDTVFLPYANWPTTTGNNDLIWVDTIAMPAPFDTFPLLPVLAHKSLEQSVFREAYNEEKFQVRVDALNMLYVAITRACHNLYIWCLKAGNKKEHIGAYLTDFVTKEGCTGNKKDGLNADIIAPISSLVHFATGLFEMGAPVIPTIASDSASAAHINPFDYNPTELHVAFQTTDGRMSFKQSNESRRFLSDGDDASGSMQNRYIDRGKLLHAVFAGIYTTADVAHAVGSLLREGMIESRAEADKITAFVSERISTGRAAEWFDGTWRVFNECSILQRTDGGTLMQRRPDRVMTKGGRTIVVDFKFGKPREEYVRQVQEYMSLLQSLGHTAVEGYLWFVYSGEILEIKNI